MTESSTVEPITVVGLMSGTSADGIDAALVRVHGSGPGLRVEILAADSCDYPEHVRQRILSLSSLGHIAVGELSAMNFLLGELFAEAALSIIRSGGLTTEDVHIIASHGQTACHDPDGREMAGRTVRSTLQLGEPSVIAERTGITVVGDFRTADVAAGGQGAPLVAYADFVLFGDRKINRAVQNIGGIANVTYLPAGCKMEEVVAFDTGPGNMLIDAAARRFFDQPYDKDGQIAARGRVDEDLLADLLCHPYFLKPPPKTTGREQFGDQFLDRLTRQANQGFRGEDWLATLTSFTAESITNQYRMWLPQMPDELILGGGGARNPTLRRMLSESLSDTPIKTHEDFGIPSDQKEAVAFAILGAETIRGIPSNVPSATGARHPAVLGKICPGRGGGRVMGVGGW
ncbi:MAG: anhydro-N-acetylmuramic acid kinase [Armatimonadetes bacterium]|nr:anhydro-N-acetylmuramic acid kinase [Armatimonadota bacterium]